MSIAWLPAWEVRLDSSEESGERRAVAADDAESYYPSLSSTSKRRVGTGCPCSGYTSGLGEEVLARPIGVHHPEDAFPAVGDLPAVWRPNRPVVRSLVGERNQIGPVRSDLVYVEAAVDDERE